MDLHLFEATNGFNWGKFAVGRPGPVEWRWRSHMPRLGETELLAAVGWTYEHLWVMDLQTGEGAIFWPGGLASADLERHRIWVCPLFEPFLVWLYEQNLDDLDALPQLVQLPNAPFIMAGYRRRA